MLSANNDALVTLLAKRC